MQVKVKDNRSFSYTVAALASLEMLNILLWIALSYGSRLLMGNHVIPGTNYDLTVVVGAYPILLLSPLLTKWCFRNCSLLPLYGLNLAQMAFVTYQVMY